MDVSRPSTVSTKVLEVLKNYLIETSANWTDGVCQGKCVNLDGSYLMEGHSACHSWVSSGFVTACYAKGHAYRWDSPYREDAKNFLVLSCHSKKRSKRVCSGEASDALVLWMAKESPFSSYVLNRDDDESLTEGGVILLCGPDGLSTAEAMWVCKVLRFTTEGAKASETFLELVNGGVDPMLAVFVASHVRSIKGATFGYTGPEGHSTVFSSYNGKGSVLGLLARNISKNADCTSSLFLTPKGSKDDVSWDAASRVVMKFCTPVKRSDGWGGTVSAQGAEGKVLVDRTLEWQKELTSFLPEGFKSTPVAKAKRAAPVRRKLPDSNTVYLDLDL